MTDPSSTADITPLTWHFVKERYSADWPRLIPFVFVASLIIPSLWLMVVTFPGPQTGWIAALFCALGSGYVALSIARAPNVSIARVEISKTGVKIVASRSEYLGGQYRDVSSSLSWSVILSVEVCDIGVEEIDMSGVQIVLGYLALCGQKITMTLATPALAIAYVARARALRELGGPSPGLGYQ